LEGRSRGPRKGDGELGGAIQRLVKIDRSGVSDGSGELDTGVTNPDFVDV
jgi:hypothetical protein